ncbi:MAG: glycosyltransferase [Roseburia sp.]|nr:glycosyltransferase [Roseburia sp.]
MIDVIAPVYNEAGNIKRLFDEIDKEIKTEKRVSVIYDFDEDDTLPVVVQIADDYDFPIRQIKNELGRGVLNAIITGFKSAEYDKVLVVMADLSDRLDVVDAMAAKMDEGFDLVCGSRYMKGGKQNGGPFLKSLFSRTAGLSLHYLTRIPTHDVTNSFKMYSKRLLDSLTIESSGGFEIGLEITVKAYTQGYRIAEVPSEWFDRTEGTSNFHMWKWMPKYLKWYFYCIGRTWFGKHSSR